MDVNDTLNVVDAADDLHWWVHEGAYIVTDAEPGGTRLSVLAPLVEVAMVSWADERSHEVRMLYGPDRQQLCRIGNDFRVVLVIPVGPVEGKPGNRVLSVEEHMIRAALNADSESMFGGQLQCVEQTEWISCGFYVVSGFATGFLATKKAARRKPEPVTVPVVFDLARDLVLHEIEETKAAAAEEASA